MPLSHLLLEQAFYPLPFRTFFSDIAIYDFDPKLPKKGMPATGKTDLEEDGSNLAIALKGIIESPQEKRQFRNLIRDLLPFVEDLTIEKFADKSLLFAVTESYVPGLHVPASLVSDGTVDMVALITALYFQRRRVIVVEEPERNIHPSLISRVVQMLKEAAAGKQIIVTTHNPFVVKYADLDDILLISRNTEGFSNICRPSQRREIQTFLQNEIGIDELLARDLLRV